ncbi:hypothetical protein DFJ74DRAFT_717053 [Hyaloraphidium curvatum]|nr:hypothetical protein DFJ74DRAFT_717027 [Hyaloraphidium curvatum]KAI9026188.1 hypothetical protein DFJ74DRAFT_717053 [Hyaloraphidium curvatum]
MPRHAALQVLAAASFAGLLASVLSTVVALQNLALFPVGPFARLQALQKTMRRFAAGLFSSFVSLFMRVMASRRGAVPCLVIHVEGRETLDGLRFEASPVIASNHLSRMDWAYACAAASSLGRGADARFALKASLAGLPLVGACLRTMGHLMLRQEWAHDAAAIGRHAGAALADSAWTVVYPEGVALSERAIGRSRAYAARQDLPHPFEGTLMPHSAGLWLLLRRLAAGGAKQSALYLVAATYGALSEGRYAEEVYTPRTMLVEGEPPGTCEWLLRRFPLDRIPGIARSTPHTADGIVAAGQRPQSRPGFGPPAKHGLGDEDAEDLASFASWLADRWLESDAALRNMHLKGDWTPLADVEDLCVVGRRQAALRRTVIEIGPSPADLGRLLAAWTTVHGSAAACLAWMGVPLLWQAAGYAAFVAIVGRGVRGWLLA